MPSKHFTDIRVSRIHNEEAARINGGSWCVEYKRDGVAKSNGFHTASVAVAFAEKLTAGELDDEALHPSMSPLYAENIILRQALETIVVMENAPAVVVQIARDALLKAGAQ
jgi:hypothetical protein